MKITSLKTRLLVWFGTITALILILFSLSFYYFLSQSINDNIQTQLENTAKDVEESLSTKNFPSATFAILSEDQKLIYKTNEFTLTDLDHYINTNKHFFIFGDDESDEDIDALYVYKSKNNFILVYKQNIDNKVEDLVNILLFLNPILLLILLFMASRMIDKILVPINSVIHTAKDISVNNFVTTIPSPLKKDEIKELVDSFNAMINRLKAGVDSMDRFNSDVSHEMKTPLTVILGEIEVTLRKTRESHEYVKSMNTIYTEAKQMQKIVENLLLLTRYTKENIQESFETFMLDEILFTVLENYSLQLQSKNIKVQQQIEKIPLRANPLLINLILSNLLDNAIKYSDNNTNIGIFLFTINGHVHFKIIDEGIGIDDTDIAKVTERFFRVDESRSKKVQGFGLGLSIVQYGVDLHNATLDIQSKPAVGTTVEIIF